jgi:hypothetical protein
VTDVTPTRGPDWTASARGYLIAWGIPSAAIIVGALVPEPVRGVIWSAALLWMGSACLINARRCGRVHCRFTGPFYLALIVPVTLLAIGVVSFGPYGWWLLGALILFGGKAIWWASERVLGTHEHTEDRSVDQ